MNFGKDRLSFLYETQLGTHEICKVLAKSSLLEKFSVIISSELIIEHTNHFEYHIGLFFTNKIRKMQYCILVEVSHAYDS